MWAVVGRCGCGVCVFFWLADLFSFVVVVVVVLSDEGSTVLLFTVAHPRRLALVPHQ